MNYLSSLPGRLGLTQDSGFSLILAFEYYDGPEKGLALFCNGEGVRFSSLGDSRSRLFRAYELLPLVGNWQQQVGIIRESEPARESKIIFPQGEGSKVMELELEVFNAGVTGHYVGIGSPDFECLFVIEVSSEDLMVLRQQSCSCNAFNSVHQLIKRTTPVS